MRTLLQDLRFALHQWRNAPGFAATAVLTLALGVGLATAMFSVIEATVLRPLPYTDPDSIVSLQPMAPRGYWQPASYPQYLDWRRANRMLQSLAGYSLWVAPKAEATEGAIPLRTVSTTDSFFEVFGVRPLLGRTFIPGEDQPGHNRVVVLSYEAWQQQYGGRPEALGSSLRMDGASYTVIGVMPAGFRYPIETVSAVYVPLNLEKKLAEARGDHWLPVVARLKPGVTLQRAALDLKQVEEGIGRIHPDEAGRRIEVAPIARLILGNVGTRLLMLTLAVLGVLATGCVNVAGLLLVRGVKRQHELGLRLALGASRGRLIRQLLSETTLLAAAGSAGGVLLAATLLQTMKPLLVPALARGADISLNPSVLVAAIVLALAGALAAGAVPAFGSSRLQPNQALRQGGTTSSAGRSPRRLRGSFIVAQIAISLLLVVVSGLLLRTLYDLLHTDVGFATGHLLTGEIQLPSIRYRNRDVMQAYYEPLLDKIEGIPGVRAAGVIQAFPIASAWSNTEIQIVGHPPAAAKAEQTAEVRLLTPGYFRALDIGLVRGRMLDPGIDVAASQPVCVVNEAFVRKFFSSGEDPIGQRVGELGGNDGWAIAGVVRDVRQVLNMPPLAEFDLPVAQAARHEDLAALALGSMTLVVRSSLAPEGSIRTVRSVMRQVDPDVSLSRIRTMPEVIADTLMFDRLQGWLFGIFAGLALLLAAVGIYGLISHEVELSTRDIGICMALGCTQGEVLVRTLRRVAWLTLAGIALGWAAALGFRKLIGAVVEIHAGHDYLFLAGLTAILAAVGLLASLHPACRAAAIEPMQALRME